jgi:hypothetical protein
MEPEGSLPYSHVQYTATCFNISKCHQKGVRYEHAEMVPNVMKSREGWELYIVAVSIMVWIWLCEESQWAPTHHVHIGLPDDGILKCWNM